MEMHEDYSAEIEYWKQIRIFVKGNKLVQNYLQDVVRETGTKADKRNRDYKARAKYTNFPSRTRNALVGSAFRIEPTVEFPLGLEYLIDNANGAKKSLVQVCKNIVTNLIEVGRHGLFVDYSNNVAKIVTYTAENIPDWHENEDGILDMVLLRRQNDGTDTDSYIRLYLDADGIYTVDFLTDEKEDAEKVIQPKKSDGSFFTEIPFIFVGSMDNAPDVDDSPLWSIVDITQGHYQNSADYEDILRFLIPTPAVTAPNKQWVDSMLPNGTYTFGDGSIIPLPEGGSATLLQANANQMHKEAMNDKENQLIMLGARLVTGGGQAETAEAVKIKYSAENGILDNLVGNVENAMQQALEFASMYMGITKEIVFKMNRDFWDTTIDPQQISAEILLLDRGIKAKADVRNTLRKAGNISNDRTDEDIDDEAEVSGAGLND